MLKLQLVVPLRCNISKIWYTCGLGSMSSCIWVDCVDLCEMSSWTGQREDTVCNLGLLVVRGDNIVCFHANMLQYWTLVMSVWLEHILCSISCGIHWGYRRELRCSTSCNCLSRRWTSSSRDTMTFSIMCWTNLWYQPARIVFMLSYLKISWASLPLPNWEKTRIELCSETSLYL